MKLFYKIIVLTFISSSLAMSQVWVEGYCYLENQIDHTDIKVVFEATSPTAVTDTVITHVQGFYQPDSKPFFHISLNKNKLMQTIWSR
jgi:hypothetical protein